MNCWECEHYTSYNDGGIIKENKLTKLTHIYCEHKNQKERKIIFLPIGYHELSAHKYNWEGYLDEHLCPLDLEPKQINLFEI